MCFIVIAFSVAVLQGDALLVQPAELAALADALPVDVRDAASFESGHIPGAAHLDVNTLSETREGVRGLLKPQDAVRELLAAAGLSPGKHLVVYSSSTSIKDATRMFWILEYLGYPRVSLLDGGYAAWAGQGLEPATGTSTVNAIDASAVPQESRPELLASKDEVKSGGCALVDLRSAEEYAGTSKKDFVKKSGHIPSATSVPADDLVQGKTSAFKPVTVIAGLLDQDADTDARVVTYCNTGRDATVGYFAYRLAGHSNVAVYDGSMAEWAESEDVVAEDK